LLLAASCCCWALLASASTIGGVRCGWHDDDDGSRWVRWILVNGSCCLSVAVVMD
jgi:hypothetical protein